MLTSTKTRTAWRIEEKVLGRRYGLVKYQLNRCLESIEEMTEIINATVHSEGFRVKELIVLNDNGYAYFLLEVIMIPLRDKQ